MPLIDAIMKLTPYPLLSAAIWTIAALLTLYLARKYFHQSIRALARLVRNALRIASVSVRSAQKRLERRNREVLVENGRQSAKRRLGKELYHINAAVEKNLKTYAALHHQVSEVITRIEEDHRSSMDVPPALPNWVPVIEAIAGIDHPGDTMVSHTLADIHGTLERQHSTAIETYRNASKTRHGILNRMLPRWLKLQKMIGELKKSVTALIDRSVTIDQHMNDYKRFQEGSETAERAALMSSLTQFLVSGLLLLVTVGGAIINIHLIALPFSEMVGGGNYIGPFKASIVAALVITTIELGLGLLIMESLKITRLFPIIGVMDDTKRSRLFACLLALLFVFAGVEASLALLRDRMVSEMASLKGMLAGVEQTDNPVGMIPAIALMIIGFVLPFWIALGAIPLATFIASTRSILGVAAAVGLGAMAFVLRLCGNVAVYTGNLIIILYDLIIFPTLWLESILSVATRKPSASPKAQSGFGLFKKFKNSSKENTPTIGMGESRK